jgi:hypothetical protein
VATKAKTFAIGKSVSHNDQSELWSHVENIADRLNALKPNNIVLGLAYQAMMVRQLGIELEA